MLKRLNTDRSLAPYVAQVVPVKLDTGSSDWQAWARQHKHEGNGIPIVYVVRADGKTLYAKSGSLRNEDLKKLLAAALADAGLILNQRDAAKIEAAQTTFDQLRNEGDVESAIKALKPINKYFDKTGMIPSFASSAVSLNQSVETLVNDAMEKIKANQEKLNKSDLPETKRASAIRQYLGIRDQFNAIRAVKSELAESLGMIRRNKELKSLYEAIRIFESAASAKTESKVGRSLKRLHTLIEDQPSEYIQSRATALIRNLEKLQQDKQ